MCMQVQSRRLNSPASVSISGRRTRCGLRLDSSGRHGNPDASIRATPLQACFLAGAPVASVGPKRKRGQTYSRGSFEPTFCRCAVLLPLAGPWPDKRRRTGRLIVHDLSASIRTLRASRQGPRPRPRPRQSFDTRNRAPAPRHPTNHSGRGHGNRPAIAANHSAGRRLQKATLPCIRDSYFRSHGRAHADTGIPCSTRATVSCNSVQCTQCIWVRRVRKYSQSGYP